MYFAIGVWAQQKSGQAEVACPLDAGCFALRVLRVRFALVLWQNEGCCEEDDVAHESVAAVEQEWRKRTQNVPLT